MLDKQSKLVLDSMIADVSRYDRYFLRSDHPLDIPDDVMEKIFRRLAAGGYVTLDEISGCIYGVDITWMGICYKEYQRLESVERWKERIVSFILGVASGVLIGWLTKMF